MSFKQKPSNQISWLAVFPITKPNSTESKIEAYRKQKLGTELILWALLESNQFEGWEKVNH